MSVDTRIILPEDVRVRDVADVIGALAGLKWVRSELNGEAWYVHAKGVDVHGIPTLPECARITLEHDSGKLIDGETEHTCLFHFEADDGKGRLLLPRSTAFWIAVGRKLIQFFGGKLSYMDVDSTIHEQKEKPRLSNCPEDGEAWLNFQAEKAAIAPLTESELESARKVAAYRDR